jgi:hypothetical protein
MAAPPPFHFGVATTTPYLLQGWPATPMCPLGWPHVAYRGWPVVSVGGRPPTLFIYLI